MKEGGASSALWSCTQHVFLGQDPKDLIRVFFTASLMLTLCLSLDCFAAYKVFPFFNSFHFTLTAGFCGCSYHKCFKKVMISEKCMYFTS